MATTDPPVSPSTTTSTMSIPPTSDAIVPITIPIATKLSESNYLTWNSQITPLLHGYNLMRFIESPSPDPTRTTTSGVLEINPEYIPWHRQDQLLLGWIRSSLTESIQSQVVSCSSTMDLWQTLQKLFSTNSRAHVLDLKRQLQSITKGDSSCSEYLQRLRHLADELAFAGVPLSNDELVSSAIRGLGSDYNPVVAAVSTTSRLEPFSFVDLRGILLSHEALLKHQSDTMAMATPAAFATGRGSNKNWNSYPSQNSFRPGNAILPTPSKTQHRPNTPQSNANKPVINTNKPTCQICSRIGHSAKLCYSRYNQDPDWKPNPRFQAYNAHTQPQLTSSNDWIIDSGATNHVTSDLNNLSSFFPYQGSDNLQIGNGMGLSISHVGSTSFTLSNCSIQLNDILHVPNFSKNLISLSRLLHDNPSLIINFSSSSCTIKDLPTMTTLLQVHSVNGLFYLQLSNHNPQAYLGARVSPNIWHARLGHPSTSTTLDVLHSNKLPCTSKNIAFCNNCAIAKAHKLPFSISSSIASSPLQIVHSDALTGQCICADNITQLPQLVTPKSVGLPTIPHEIQQAHNETSSPSVATRSHQPIAESSAPEVLITAQVLNETDRTGTSSDRNSLLYTSTEATPAVNRAPSQPVHSMTTRSKDNSRKPRYFPEFVAFHASLESEPTSFTKANSDPTWRQAMANELDALARNNTWSLVPPPQNQKIIGCKWVFRIKRKPDGSVERHKARLVAKGFHQEHGVDFLETYSPVVRPSTIRLALSLAVVSNWEIRQLDVQNAFLHGDLNDRVYMTQPQGFVDPSHPNHVCLLHKSLYGLKQAPRAWFHKLSSALLSLHFIASNYDPSLFVSHHSGQTLLVLVYVDDIIITGSDSKAVHSCISLLQQHFALKDLGPIHYFLGLEAKRSAQGLHLSQTKYILDLLTRLNMVNAKPCTTPMATDISLMIGDSEPFDDPHLYRSVVGALQYATLTRPDLSYAVNKVSQFMHNPTTNQWAAVKRILRYLCGSITHGLFISKGSPLELHAFSDADWAGSQDDRRSTSGFCIYLGNNIISWSAKKQPTVSRSSTEAEYRSLALACTEIMWLQYMLKELGVNLSSAPTLWCDNIGATFLAANPMFHARTKHIEIDYHFVRERVATKELNVHYICSSDQIGDIMTKPLSSARFSMLRNKLTVLSTTSA
ncbi:hypothetical protein LUZ62_071810 [Rhynchospora pubera]|uniref:Reverse transcriptase Ty1/copia-type domain-containing protein n=1 Tax=Rhynchospora pubera TaxID=906938 RepID=A0AAV8CZ40_9POAL|nr:hypothetical protein LUZ62_071810 [Rhynchospora pubera]